MNNYLVLDFRIMSTYVGITYTPVGRAKNRAIDFFLPTRYKQNLSKSIGCATSMSLKLKHPVIHVEGVRTAFSASNRTETQVKRSG